MCFKGLSKAEKHSTTGGKRNPKKKFDMSITKTADMSVDPGSISAVAIMLGLWGYHLVTKPEDRYRVIILTFIPSSIPAGVNADLHKTRVKLNSPPGIYLLKLLQNKFS